LQRYFTKFKDYVWSYKIEILETVAAMIGTGIAIAFLWMFVIYRWGELMIKITIVATLVNLAILCALNFAFLNIPGGILLGIYLVIKLIVRYRFFYFFDSYLWF